MTKTIWYISKYCDLSSKKSEGSRGWILMKEFAAKGYQSLIITSDYKDLIYSPNDYSRFKNYIKEGVKIVILKTLKYSVSKSVLRIFSWFDFELNLFWLDKKSMSKPDVIIVSSLSLLTILNGVFLKKKYKCKLVFEIRDIWPLTIVEEGGFSRHNLFIIFLQFIESWGYNRSDLIVGTMPNLSEHVKNVSGYSKLVDCIPMGIDPTMLINTQSVNPEYIEQYLNPNYFNVVYTGTVGITNALDTFFKAAETLTKNPKIKFVIVGDGALKKIYQKQYSHLPNLIFAPKVYNKQVQSILLHADVLYFSVFKSKVWHYGQSLNKVIDYMISNKPIVASYSGYPSMINEAGCGFFIPAEDTQSLVEKIKEMSLMTEYQRNAIGTKGRDWLLENRTYKKLADDYLRLLFEYKN